MDVSVIIVSYNTRDLLRRCLKNVEAASEGVSGEIIVVDNGSRDGSGAMVQAEFPAVTLIEAGMNLGFGCANNVGFRSAKGRYWVILNSDAFLPPHALMIAVRHMDSSPKVAIGGARLTHGDGSWQPCARLFPSLLNDFLIMSGLAGKYPGSRFFGRADRTWASSLQAAFVDWVPGAFSILRPEALRRIGFFDERFFFYFEEVDLCRRAKNAGYQVAYWPDIVVVHLEGASSWSSDRGADLRKQTWFLRGRFQYYRKHHAWLYAYTGYVLERTWYAMRAIKKRLFRQENPFQEYAACIAKAWRESSRDAS